MTVIRLENVTASRIMEIAKELRNSNMDFTFSYHPSKWDIAVGSTPNYTNFTFNQARDATWFVLKYVKH
ncbi:MAG: hypothetical protein EBU90_11510 [Proteobacteria bacterium]|nr:hypothetical protein [Pseudomonadota bacterium]NBP14606.1 hypothetical protein [bacterium]